LVSEVGLDSLGDEVEGALILLSVGFDYSEHGFDEAISVGALCAERRRALRPALGLRTHVSWLAITIASNWLVDA
jgi:hypothetical protein